MSVLHLSSSSNTLIPLEVIQLQNTLLNMITSSQEYFLGQNRLYYYAVSDDLLLVLENTPLNQQIINNYAIHYDSTRQFSLKFVSRSGGASELGIQGVLHELGSSITIGELNQINALTYTTSNFSRGALLHGNDFDENEILLFHSNNKIKSSNKTLNEIVDVNTEQVISAPKTFASHLNLTFISTPAGTDNNNLLTRNQTNGRIQQSNITNDKIVLTDTEQTITGAKSLTSHLQLTNITTPAGTDTNNILTRNQTNGRIQQSSITNDKLVLTDAEQSISGGKTFTGNVKLQNLPQATGTVSKVLVKNPTTNQIEEAATSNVIGSTSTASTIAVDSIRTNNYTLSNEEFPSIPVLNGLGQTLPFNSYSLVSFQYASNGGVSGASSPLQLQQSGSKIQLADVGLYKFELTFSFLHSPPTFTLTKNSGEFYIELYIDNTLADRQIKYIEANDFRAQTVVLYYRNLTNAVVKLADIRTFHNVSATTQAQGDPDALAFPLLSRALTVLSVVSYGTETKAIDVGNDTTNSNTMLLTKADGTIVKNNSLTPATIALKSEIPTVPSLTNYATLDTNQTITGVKTFEANDLVLNPITTAAATTNKLLTRNQSNKAVEETNVAVSQLCLSANLGFNTWAKWATGGNIPANTWTTITFGGATVDYVNVNSSLVPISTTDNQSFVNSASTSKQFLVTYVFDFGASMSQIYYATIILPNGNRIARATSSGGTFINATAIINLSPGTSFAVQFYPSTACAIYNSSYISISCING